MKTIILPGYSEHNREWAQEIKKQIDVGNNLMIHEWRHWKEKSLSLRLGFEIKKIMREIGSEEINIIAKSVGVSVALNLIPKIPLKVNKVILCGIASIKGENKKKLMKKAVEIVGVKNILCIQNQNDKYVPYQKAKEFYLSAEPRLKVISKPRSDHEYPYFEDFQNFLFG